MRPDCRPGSIKHSHKLHNSAFRLLRLFGNLTLKKHAKQTNVLQEECASAQISLNIHASSVLQRAAWPGGYVVKRLQNGPLRDATAKPGVKDILRAEITPRCWEHEQAVRVSFTHHGSQCVLSDRRRCGQKFKQLQHRHHFFHSP